MPSTSTPATGAEARSGTAASRNRWRVMRGHAQSTGTAPQAATASPSAARTVSGPPGRQAQGAPSEARGSRQTSSAPARAAAPAASGVSTRHRILGEARGLRGRVRRTRRTRRVAHPPPRRRPCRDGRPRPGPPAAAASTVRRNPFRTEAGAKRPSGRSIVDPRERIRRAAGPPEVLLDGRGRERLRAGRGQRLPDGPERDGRAPPAPDEALGDGAPLVVDPDVDLESRP